MVGAFFLLPVAINRPPAMRPVRRRVVMFHVLFFKYLEWTSFKLPLNFVYSDVPGLLIVSNWTALFYSTYLTIGIGLVMNLMVTCFFLKIWEVNLNDCEVMYRDSQTYAISSYVILKKRKKIFDNIFKTRTERGEMTVAEEYCWAMTQALGRLYCGRSGSSVMEFEFQLDCLAYTHIVDQVCSQFQLAPDCCANRRV